MSAYWLCNDRNVNCILCDTRQCYFAVPKPWNSLTKPLVKGFNFWRNINYFNIQTKVYLCRTPFLCYVQQNTFAVRSGRPAANISWTQLLYSCRSDPSLRTHHTIMKDLCKQSMSPLFDDATVRSRKSEDKIKQNNDVNASLCKCSLIFLGGGTGFKHLAEWLLHQNMLFHSE